MELPGIVVLGFGVVAIAVGGRLVWRSVPSGHRSPGINLLMGVALLLVGLGLVATAYSSAVEIGRSSAEKPLTVPTAGVPSTFHSENKR